MGIKNLFKRKEEQAFDPGLDDNLFGDSGSSQQANDPFANDPILGTPRQPGGQIGEPIKEREYRDPMMSGARQEPGLSQNSSREIELILAKLDMIKSELDGVNLRLQKIEKIVDGTSKQTKRDEISW
ncbi:MAG: hypothetical protein H6502_03885 [Candidatus Woesearchaeota archaeon]|nr:MAG: hypothetical protein H6502_03885 [Candidatus Woesearchaeota archaeon]